MEPEPLEGTASRLCTAFAGPVCLATGPLRDVVLVVARALEAGVAEPVLTFDDATGRVIDLDTRGSGPEVLARLAPGESAPRGRGRPRLGVVAREVTLLPRHWAWLNAQPGGASVALRKLVENARRDGTDLRREAQERTYRFLSALAGDEPGYEEALRALFAGDAAKFQAEIRAWPQDVRDHALRLALPALEPSHP